MCLPVFPLSIQYQKIFEKRVVETLEGVRIHRNQDSIYVTSEIRFGIEVQSKKNIKLYLWSMELLLFIFRKG